MDKKPEFIILAGPNGAGKSTNGHLFVPPSVSIFNGDLVLAILVKRYPEIEPARLHGGVAKALEDARDIALISKTDFAFESNYSTDMATDITVRFKEAGYKTTLVYFGLDSLKQSAARVKERKLLGGHDVTAEILQYNFEEGIQRINRDLHLFDTILFVDTQHQNTRIIVLIDKEEHKQINIAENINWFDEYFNGSVKALNLQKGLVKQIRQHHK